MKKRLRFLGTPLGATLLATVLHRVANTYSLATASIVAASIVVLLSMAVIRAQMQIARLLARLTVERNKLRMTQLEYEEQRRLESIERRLGVILQ